MGTVRIKTATKVRIEILMDNYSIRNICAYLKATGWKTQNIKTTPKQAYYEKEFNDADLKLLNNEIKLIKILIGDDVEDEDKSVSVDDDYFDFIDDCDKDEAVSEDDDDED